MSATPLPYRPRDSNPHCPGPGPGASCRWARAARSYVPPAGLEPALNGPSDRCLLPLGYGGVPPARGPCRGRRACALERRHWSVVAFGHRRGAGDVRPALDGRTVDPSGDPWCSGPDRPECGGRGSNPRPSPWEGDALPAALPPRATTCGRPESDRRCDLGKVACCHYTTSTRSRRRRLIVFAEPGRRSERVSAVVYPSATLGCQRRSSRAAWARTRVIPVQGRGGMPATLRPLEPPRGVEPRSPAYEAGALPLSYGGEAGRPTRA